MKKYNQNQRAGSLNHSYGVAESEEARLNRAFGEKFSSIDFEFDLEESDYPIKNSTQLGVLIVGDYRISLSLGEMDRVMRTLEDTLTTVSMKGRLGVF
jgi:hypothetical protein